MVDHHRYTCLGPSCLVSRTEWHCLFVCFLLWELTCFFPFPPFLLFLVALFCSKEGAPQVRLKVALFTDENGHNFTFVSPNARNEREKFKKELTGIVSVNKTAAEAGSRGPPPVPITPLTATPTTHKTSNLNAPTPTPHVLGRVPHPHPPLLPLPPSRAVSVTSEKRATTPTIVGVDHAKDFKLRKRVLMSNPDLAALHKDLVIGGQITEAEFWDGREVFLSNLTIILWGSLHVCNFSLNSIYCWHKLQQTINKRVNPGNWSTLAQKPWKEEKLKFESHPNLSMISLTNTL